MTERTKTGRRAIAIVGNAPEMGDHAQAIDACDMVVRFNRAAGFGKNAGRRVTHLALVNRGGQPREWVQGNGLAELPALRHARKVIFPFPPLADGPPGLCWTREMTLALAPFRVRPRALAPRLHELARADLRRLGALGPIAPSSGFLLAYEAVHRFGSAADIRVFGFGFDGWSGHAWDVERRWFEAAERAGRLDLRAL